MICCVLIASVVALAVRFWRLMTLQPIRHAEVFPPVAKRLAPGQISASDIINPKAVFDSKFTTNKLLMFYASCIGLYSLLIVLLIQSGSFQADFNQSEWLYRNAIYASLFVYFALLSLFPGRKKQTLGRMQFRGSAVTILGIVFTILFIADFHLFQVLQFSNSDHQHHQNHSQLFLTSEYLALHGLAFIPIVVGQMIFHRGKSISAASCA